MSSLAAKARFARLGGLTGSQNVPQATTSQLPRVIVEAGTARVAQLTDAGNIVSFTNAAACTYTIKAYSSVPIDVGQTLVIFQFGAGQVEVVPDVGVSFETPDTYKTRDQKSFIAMYQYEQDKWKALGDLETSSLAYSVLGRYASTDGAVAPIVAAAVNKFLVRRAGGLQFDSIAESDVTGLTTDLSNRPVKSDIQANSLKFAIADVSGTADAIVAALTPAITAYTDGMEISLRAIAANATATPTINVNGLGAITIVKQGGVALVAGDIKGANHEIILRYRAGSPGKFELLNPYPQNRIQFKSGGGAVGSLGGVNEVNFTGAGVSAAEASGVLTVTISGGGGGGGSGVDLTALPYVVNPLGMRGCWGYTAVNGPAGTTSVFVNVNSARFGQSIGGSGAVTPAGTNAFTRQTRFRYSTTGAAGSTAANWGTAADCYGDGGFFYCIRAGNADVATVAQARCFYGLYAGLANPGNVNPSSLLNVLGFGADSGDANMQFIYNDGSGTASKIDLGASFPANTSQTDWYEMQLLQVPGSGVVKYHIRNCSNGATASGSVNTDIPSGSTGLARLDYRGNGTTALAVSYHYGGIVIAYSLDGL